MTRIKICGIKEEAHAIALAKAGIDFIGLVFATSPRQVTPYYAKKNNQAIAKQEEPDRNRRSICEYRGWQGE